MPVGLSLFASIFATLGFFVSVFAVIVLAIEARRSKAKPKIGLCPGSGPGTMGVWVNWDTNQFALQVYRLRISHVSPNNKLKEGTFTVTFDAPQSEPFVQQIKLPDTFKAMLERDADERSLLSFEFRTVDEMSLSLDATLRKAKKIYRGAKGRMPSIKNILAPIGQDVATVFSLDFTELQARKARMKGLEAAAAAKAAKTAAAKPAAAAAPVAAVATAAAPAPAPAPTPTVEAAAPSPAPAAPKSVRDVVSATNKGQTDKGGDK